MFPRVRLFSLSLWDGDFNATGGRRWAATALALALGWLLQPPPDIRTPEPVHQKEKD
jgi:hypothetical protein